MSGSLSALASSPDAKYSSVPYPRFTSVHQELIYSPTIGKKAWQIKSKVHILILVSWTCNMFSSLLLVTIAQDKLTAACVHRSLTDGSYECIQSFSRVYRVSHSFHYRGYHCWCENFVCLEFLHLEEVTRPTTSATYTKCLFSISKAAYIICAIQHRSRNSQAKYAYRYASVSEFF